MPSDRSTQADILQRILDRLLAKIPELTELNCFFSDQPVPPLWPDGEICCTLSVPEGRFPEPFSTGGGVLTLCANTTLDVCFWVRSNLDSPPDFQAVLMGERGLWSRWQPDVLRALLLEEETSGQPDAWMPKGSDGAGLLRNQLAVLRTSAVRADATGEWLGVTLSFGIDFDWRL